LLRENAGVKKRIISKTVQFLAAVTFVVLLNFFLPRLLPGDPLSVLANDINGGTAMTEENLAYLKSYYGLDLPLHNQLFKYITGLFRGDWGYSYYYKVPVSQLIIKHFPWTVLLTGVSLVLAVVAGVGIGVVGAAFRGTWREQFLFVFSAVLRAVPSFFLGALLVLLIGYKLAWLPISGAVTTGLTGSPGAVAWDISLHLILPALTLAFAQLPGIFLMTRSALLDVLKEDYITIARFKGLSGWRVYMVHALPNVLPTLVTLIGMRFGFAAGGAIMVEAVFGYPGMGSLMESALNVRDYPVLQAGFMVISLYVLVINLLADLIAARLNPRLRFSETRGDYVA